MQYTLCGYMVSFLVRNTCWFWDKELPDEFCLTNIINMRRSLSHNATPRKYLIFESGFRFSLVASTLTLTLMITRNENRKNFWQTITSSRRKIKMLLPMARRTSRSFFLVDIYSFLFSGVNLMTKQLLHKANNNLLSWKRNYRNMKNSSSNSVFYINKITLNIFGNNRNLRSA